jgi:hypothetical protein
MPPHPGGWRADNACVCPLLVVSHNATPISVVVFGMLSTLMTWRFGTSEVGGAVLFRLFSWRAANAPGAA